MPRQHKHWPEDHPFYERAPWHVGTMKACDEQVTQYNHGHLGTPCIKAIQESKSKRGRMNKIETCTIVNLPEHGQSFDTSLRSQQEHYGGTLNAGN